MDWLVLFFSIFVICYILGNIAWVICMFFDWYWDKKEARKEFKFQAGRVKILEEALKKEIEK